jgi:hypothetical protein
MALNKLNAVKVKNVKKAGRHADGGGLYLQVKKRSRRAAA